MKSMALELDDRDMMVILLLLFCKRDNFRNHLLDWSDSKQVLDRAFPPIISNYLQVE